jgi:CO/xanthine dehydrogenase Mo-binding subunit
MSGNISCCGAYPNIVTAIQQALRRGIQVGSAPQYQLFLAVMAAHELKRSVKVSLTRQQMFTSDHHPETRRRLALGATSDGTLEAITPEALAETSQFEDYSENVVNWSGVLYQCNNVKLGDKVEPLDLSTPVDTRAPGAVWGLFALKCMDELAYKLSIDPLQLRLKKYAERDQNEDKPFRVRNCTNVTSKARKNSAGRNAIHSRARCATAISWSGEA